MSLIDDYFRDLRARHAKAFMPFVTAGDPDLDFTADLLRELDRRGCGLCELGIPYSDPIADGPVIQASYTRALGHGTSLAQIFEMLKRVRPDISMRIVMMVSYPIVLRKGLNEFVAAAKEVGVGGAIVPDLLVEEAGPLATICRRHDFSLIQLATPTTPKERAERIAANSTGFLYYVSVTGITGERTELPPDLVESVSWLRARTALPICIGFGISQPEHVRLLAPVADGLIVGSAIVRRMARVTSSTRSDVLTEIGEFAVSMMRELASPTVS